MVQPPRIEFAGAVHHAIERGDRRKEIFRDDRDRSEFLGRFVPERLDNAYRGQLYEGRWQRPLRFPASPFRKPVHQSMEGLNADQNEPVKLDELRLRLDRDENQAKPRPLSAEPRTS